MDRQAEEEPIVELSAMTTTPRDARPADAQQAEDPRNMPWVPACCTAAGSGVLKPESDLQAHLEMGHAAVLDLAPDLGDLEPVQVPQGLPGPVQAVADRGLDAFGRGADDLRHPVCPDSHDPSRGSPSAATHPPGGRPERARPVHGDHGIVTAMVADIARRAPRAGRCRGPEPAPGMTQWRGRHSLKL